MPGVTFFTGDEIVSYIGEDQSASSKLSDLEKRVIEKYQTSTGRWFGEEKTFIEWKESTGKSDTVYVANIINTLTKVEVGPIFGLPSALTELENIQGVTMQTIRNRVLRLLGPFPAGFLKVTYVAGYSVEDVPSDVKQDILDILSSLWRGRLDSLGQDDDFTDGNIPKHVKISMKRHTMRVGL